MATKLVIVESPTKAHKIGDYLGKGYTVMASVGHIRDLAQPSQVPAADKAKFGKFGVDVNDGFKPYYIVDGDKKRTVSELKSALKNADELYLATAGQAHGVPRDHQERHQRLPEQHARCGWQYGRRTGDPPHPRPSVRL